MADAGKTVKEILPLQAPGARVFVPEVLDAVGAVEKPARYIKLSDATDRQLAANPELLLARETPRLSRVLIGNIGHWAVNATLANPVAEAVLASPPANWNLWLVGPVADHVENFGARRHDRIENWVDRRGHIRWFEPDETRKVPRTRWAAGKLGHLAVNAHGFVRRVPATDRQPRHDWVDWWVEHNKVTDWPADRLAIALMGHLAVVGNMIGTTQQKREARIKKIDQFVARGARPAQGTRSARGPSIARRSWSSPLPLSP